MNYSKRYSVKSSLSILYLGIAYGILAPALLYIETLLVGQKALQQVVPLSLVAIAFFAFTLLEFYVVKQVQNRPQLLTQIYLVNKVLRLILSIVGLGIYLWVCGKNNGLFFINLFVFYLFTVVYTTLHYVKREHKQSTNS